MAASHAISSARNSGGSRISAWSSRPRIQERRAGNPATRRQRTTDPSSRRLSTLSLPTSSATRGPSMASTRMRVTTWSSPSARQGSSGRDALMSMPSGRTAPPGGPSAHRVLDPVDAKRAHRFAVEVPGHQVPVPEAEPEPGRGHAARPSGGRRTTPRSGCAPLRRGRSRAAGVTSVAMGRTSPRPVAPSFKSASRPLGSSRCTPATARWRATCSSGSSARSGR